MHLPQPKQIHHCPKFLSLANGITQVTSLIIIIAIVLVSPEIIY